MSMYREDPTHIDLNDRQLLSRLEADDRLTDTELHKFRDMRQKLDVGSYRTLSKPQRQWAEKRFHELELGAQDGAKNLISEGLIKPSKHALAMDAIGPHVPEHMRRPPHPPGRICTTDHCPMCRNRCADPNCRACTPHVSAPAVQFDPREADTAPIKMRVRCRLDEPCPSK
jgi:hypothetical protein